MFVSALVLADCGRPAAPPQVAPADALAAALRPPAVAAGLRRAGGAHWKGTALFRAGTGDGPGAAPEAVTTTTELWVDRRGHYRFAESNDLDGGREVTLHGRDLVVALKHGKAVKRPAQEPEPTHLLEEAVGAPWAAWETVARFGAVERTAPGTYRLTLASQPRPLQAAPSAPLRKWRDSIAVQALEGEARIAEGSGALLAFSLRARFAAQRDGKAIAGEVAVTTRADGLGTTPEVAPPAAEELSVRQRTILEERALLGDLARKGASR